MGLTDRQLQTSDHRFRAISALISAGSPEKMDRNAKLRATSGTTNIHKQSSPLSYRKNRGIHYNTGYQKIGVDRLNPVQKATYLKKKSKVGINEMYNNCQDSYRPVIIGFVQYQHSSVQLVLKKWIGMPS